MDFIEPRSLGDALAALAAHDDARCIAGGATLVAMMNADLLAPGALVSLRHLRELRGIEERDGELRIGAMTRHAEIAADERLRGAWGVVRHAAGQIAHPAVRNMGTIGGSICHADPNADFPTALTAAGARVEALGRDGPRTIAIDDFFRNYLETALAPGEFVTAIVLPRSPAGARGRHLKFARVHGDYATISVAAVVATNGGRCTHARVAVGSAGPRPVHVAAADAALTAEGLTAAAIARAGALLAQAADPVDDVRGSGAYRRRLIPRLVARLLTDLRSTDGG